MSKLKQIKWQQKLLESKEKKVLCNVGRWQGKNFAMLLEIIESKPEKVIVISKVSSSVECGVALDKIEEIKQSGVHDLSVVSMQGNNICLVVKERNKTYQIDIDFINFYKVDDMNIYNIENTLFVMQECIEESILKYDNPFGIVSFISYRDVQKSKEILFDKVIRSGISDGLNDGIYNDEVLFDIEKYGNELLREFDILDECKLDFLESTLKSLENEYNKILPASNNVMSRKNILDMILGVRKEIRESRIPKK